MKVWKTQKVLATKRKWCPQKTGGTFLKQSEKLTALQVGLERGEKNVKMVKYL